MFALIRKYREVLALLGLLAAAALTFFAHNKDPSVRSPAFEKLARVVLKVEAPPERWLNSGVGTFIDAWRSYVDLRHVRAENQTLRQRVFELQDQLEARAGLEQENNRLRNLLHFAEASQLKTVAAPVVGDSLAPAALTRVVRIGTGQNAGVQRGMAVISAQGAVGRVVQVAPTFADVQLLVDPASAVAVRVERSRARANVVGTGNDRRAKLEYALRSDDIEEGDSLVTSGTDGVFPPGLPVGRVSEVQRKTSAAFLHAQVVPEVDPRHLEEVLVVLVQPPAADTGTAAK